ncbi:MAG: P-II family nitrogen regulator [Pyrinomonadaceae bacterium]
MRIITAMIQPFMFHKVASALETIEGFPGMTVTDVKGFGRRQSAREEYSMHLDEFHPKTRIEIVTADEMVRQIVNAIADAAHTGNHGDGKVFVWPVEQAVRIQTGEIQEEAL